VNVLVCGSRSWRDSDLIEARLRQLPRGTQIINGGARGADRLAATIAGRLGFDVWTFPAQWESSGVYNPRAGLERNIEMLDGTTPDLVLAFWDGRSTGTAHTIEQATRRGIKVEVIHPERVP
jgi:SLOG family YspA-like protein